MPKIADHYRHNEYRNADEKNPDGRSGNYYVTVIDGGRFALALGPFDTHREALARVDDVRDHCYASDDKTRSWFWGYGTSRIDRGDNSPAGSLNDALGLERACAA